MAKYQIVIEQLSTGGSRLFPTWQAEIWQPTPKGRFVAQVSGPTREYVEEAARYRVEEEIERNRLRRDSHYVIEVNTDDRYN